MRTSRMVSSRFAPVEARSDGPDQLRRQQHAASTITDVASARIAPIGAGHAARFLLVPFGQQARIDRNEGSGEHAFAEQILQEIGNAKGRRESIGGVELAEVMREDALPHQPDDAG